MFLYLQLERKPDMHTRPSDSAKQKGTQLGPWVSAFLAGLLYFGCAVLWFGVLERMADAFIANPERRLLFKGLTGLAFVIATAIGIVVIVRRELAKQLRTQAALRESEARLAELVRSAMDAIITINASQRIVLFNHAAEQMFGCSAADAQGQSIERFIPACIHQAHQKHIQNFGVRGATSRRMGSLGAVQGLRADGQEFPIEASISTMEAGGQKFFTVILRDISQRLRMEEELRQLNSELEKRVSQRTAELEATNRELEAFCFSVSHDLRAPLRAIGGFSEALEQDTRDHLNAPAREHLQRIRAAAERMGQLIDALLELSRITRTEMHWEPVDLSVLAQTVVSDLRQTSPARPVDVVLQPGLVACGDPHLLRSVLENLLGNAWKFTARTPQPRVEFDASQAADGSLIFSVRDNGAGFDMEYAGKLFGPFQRLHGRNEYEGTGIGLAVCQRIIQRHGGRIWAEGRPNAGATIRFTLGAPFR